MPRYATRNTPYALLLALILPLLLAACQRVTPTPTPTLTPSPTEPPPTLTPTITPTSTSVPDPPPIPFDFSNVGISPTLSLDDLVVFGYTHISPDGNRVITGTADLPNTEPLAIPLDGAPRWVVGAPLDTGTLWAVVLEDGTVQGYLVSQGRATPISIPPGTLPPGAPPLLAVDHGVPRLVTAPRGDASPLTHPIVISGTRKIAYIDTQGDLILWDDGEIGRLALNAPPDARILQDEHQHLLLLTGATTEYNHSVLGDGIEASSITLLETTPALGISVTIPLTAGTVVEGMAPIWADVTGDGAREIIVTLSDETRGARLAVFDQNGVQIASGPTTGRGYRWRHQLVATAFSSERIVLADILTPHIGGVVEFYTFTKEDGLEVAATKAGYSSHQIGSRNLDMAFAADLDADAARKLELLVPNQDMTALNALRLSNNNRVDVAWTLALPAPLSTNLAAFIFPNGQLAVGLGTADGTLLIWLPEGK